MPDPAPVYLDYDQAALDAQYDQRTLVPDSSPWHRAAEAAGAAARRDLACRADVPYGPTPIECLDAFPAPGDGGAPVLVHIHGGAWVRLRKAHATPPAPIYVRAGAAYVAPDFAPASEVTLDEMVRQVRAAVAWVHANAASLGADPERLYVSGHSSGAHLASMVLADGWRAGMGLPEDLVKGAVISSGPYDLEPVRRSYRNDYLKLDAAAARRLNPLHHIPGRAPPLLVAWGEGDLDEFRRQGRAFADAWRAAGHRCETVELAGHHHFDVGARFADPDGPFARAMLGMMGLG